MPAEATLPENAFLALVILTTIPVAALALWCDYFGRRIDAAAQNKDRDAPEFNRAAELATLQWAGIFSFIAQAMIYLVSRPIRLEHPLASLLMFVAALVAQTQIQFAVERRLRQLSATPAEHAKQTGRSFGWMSLAMLAYFGTIAATGAAFYFGASLFGATPAVSAVSGFLGTTLGIFLGLGVTYALAPLHLQRLFPVTKLEDPVALKVLGESFAQAGLQAPRCFVMELDQFRASNAMIAGFQWGTGSLAPAVFITRSLLSQCTPDQLRAILLHEVAHIDLQHLRRRFIYSCAVVIGSTLACLVALVAAHFLLPPALAELIRWTLPLAAFTLPLVAIRTQVLEQELQADAHAVIGLDAGLESMVSALRRLDALNDRAEGANSPTHPATDERIEKLRAAARLAGIEGVTKPAPEQSEIKAA